jgi:hypothetical protein
MATAKGREAQRIDRANETGRPAVAFILGVRLRAAST